MSQPFLDRVRSEIRARAEELRPAAEEHDLLSAALTALDGVEPARPSARSQASPVRRRSTATKPQAKRAPRGANRAAVLRVLEERPGVSVAELAAASGVSRPVLYNLVKTLEEKGEIQREELPGGTTGYRVAASGEASAPES